ncbi:MAG TPA: molybdate ABC transporter permease subunit [Gammaproteobacteria bacterium]|jgi:molybdate transport system permease protein|nr:molybdate ABC transporter permease subunit [Gammaproteobacteria bacterium]HIA58833.1 molybdate ABC transporter permease subunit [Gammaproteobacteria bacterium]HIF88019.1 molybdate ABC transporter permease subunit [Gammaproteobacteria bacterium]HIL64260.1 molybdate ABC transporter permease subunit [Porticoccaceae bacterium]HIN89904.1 molybdate ABC transporter permease subunit [Porticoccaceae bacterium]|tara:strand:+ start:6660 stop:7343 length:684 start_codon:yes stop_codon:yes gene_type:complete
MLEATDFTAFTLTLKLAGVSTLILLCLGTPLAWWLSQTRIRGKSVVEALIALPLVLPPTVLGFYLLLALSPSGPIGSSLDFLGLPSLAFTFSGLVLGSVIYSLPFVVQPLQTSFIAIGRRPLEVAATLGAGPLDRFLNIVLPMSKIGYLTAIVLGFAHTMGEFGVVLMIGGNIPGQTQVLSIAIYNHVEALEYSQAHLLAGLLLCFSFLVLLTVYTLNKRALFLSRG